MKKKRGKKKKKKRLNSCAIDHLGKVNRGDDSEEPPETKTTLYLLYMCAYMYSNRANLGGSGSKPRSCITGF